MAVARVQATSANGTSTNPTCTWGSTTTAGNLLIAALHLSSGTIVITPPSPWVLAVRPVPASGTPSAAIYYCANASAQSGAIAFTVGSTDWIMELLEYSGLATTNPLGPVNSAFSDTAATTINSGTTAGIADTTGLAFAAFSSTSIASAQHSTPTGSGWGRVQTAAMASGKMEMTGAEKIGSLTALGESSTVTIGTGKKNSGAIAVFYVTSSNPPANTVAPAVTGTTTADSVLTTTNGTWTGTATITYTYQWKQANDLTGTSGVSTIGGATSSTFTLTNSQFGKYVFCVVTGTNGVGNSSANSNVVGPIAGRYTEAAVNATTEICANDSTEEFFSALTANLTTPAAYDYYY